MDIGFIVVRPLSTKFKNELLDNNNKKKKQLNKFKPKKRAHKDFFN
jgi:hypothetical protein